MTYLATVLPGLEEVAASELAAKVPEARLVEAQRGKLFFDLTGPGAAGDATVPRTFDNVYLLLARFSVGPRREHLRDVEAAARAIDLRGALPPAEGERTARSPSPTFFVNASRSGRHAYSRFEAAAAAARGIAAAQPGWSLGDAYDHDLELRLDVAGDRALLSLRLTPPSYRYRVRERAFARAALRPSLAHALVWLTHPRADDRVIDPFCGSGTILEERLAYPARWVVGGDLDPAALSAARANVPPAGGAVVRWDARRLPLADGAVDTILTNLPFGRQISRPDAVPRLYRASVREMRRVLTPRGRIVLLTDRTDALLDAAAAVGLAAADTHPLSLKGLHPTIVALAPS